MIAIETVFVLGAGASVPFNFPTGAELRQRLCTELRLGFGLNALLQECGQDNDLINRFRNEFERSGINSIDNFIAFRPAYQEIGELAIAAVLVPLEDQAKLTSVAGKPGNGGWYQMLWNEMLAGVSEPQELLLNRVCFVTFNYDRSLEQYLLNAISHAFGLVQNAAFQLLSQIPIQHVYGSLGSYSAEQGFRYGGHDQSTLKNMLLAATQSIKTVPAVRGPKDELSASWLAKAQRVFVMGFGFDPANCARIDLPAACSQTPRKVTPRNVFASAFNLTHAEVGWCEANSCSPGQGGLIWTNGDCLALLRDRRNFLTE